MVRIGSSRHKPEPALRGESPDAASRRAVVAATTGLIRQGPDLEYVETVLGTSKQQCRRTPTSPEAMKRDPAV
jgi:hypothetical protein